MIKLITALAGSLMLSMAMTAGGNAGTWQHVGGDIGGRRFSQANQITRDNVGSLEVAWRYSTGDAKAIQAHRQDWKFQATPILFEGSLVFCTPVNDVIALDPGTGEERWRYRHGLLDLERTGNGLVCRGVTAWHDSREAPDTLCISRIFMATNDFRLMAIDARTGQLCEGFGEDGAVDIDPQTSLLFAGEVQMTSPPIVVDNVVVVGSAIADNMRVRAPPGTIHAFDARTGDHLWDFDPVPRDPNDPASESWGAGSPNITGQANVWTLMSADQERGLIFVPTSSPSTDHYGGMRPGQNHYANSIVALKADTGKIVWHFQTVHHDLWDYDLSAQPTLIDLRRGGRNIPAVVQPTKMGLIFTFHRSTGEPLFEIKERPVPQGNVPGEWYSPSQPFPVAPPMLVPDNLEPQDAWGVTFWDRAICREKIESHRYEGIYTPPSLKGTIHYPFVSGGVNWGSAAFDYDSQTLFVLTNNASGYVRLIPREGYPERDELDVFKDGIASQTGTPYLVTRQLLTSPFGAPCNPPPWGEVHAINMATGTIRWHRALGTLEDFVPFGDLLLPHGSGNMGGPIVTAGGLIFVAATMDDYIRALDVTTGAELWKRRLPAGGQATPMTYTWKGRQYVVIAAGGHSVLGTTLGDSVVAFALTKDPGPWGGSAFDRLRRPTTRWSLLVLLVIGLATALWVARKKLIVMREVARE